VSAPAIAREGTFKARPTAWSVRRLNNGNVCIRVEFEAFAIRSDGGKWAEGPPRSVRGDFFPLKKTGAPNEKIAAMLCNTLGWGGTFTEITETPPLDAVVQIDVEGRDYNGKTYFDVKWVRAEGDDGRKPEESLGAVEVVALDKKHGADLKAIASKVKKAPAKAAEDDGIPF